jgi:hypothetical protein
VIAALIAWLAVASARHMRIAPPALPPHPRLSESPAELAWMGTCVARSVLDAAGASVIAAVHAGHPADDPISTLSAAACRNRFDSSSSLTARERSTAATIVERMAMALPPASSPLAPPTHP